MVRGSGHTAQPRLQVLFIHVEGMGQGLDTGLPGSLTRWARSAVAPHVYDY